MHDRPGKKEADAVSLPPGWNSALLRALTAPPRRKVFVSYHHAGDQAYYDTFSRTFHDTYETIFDNSVDRRIGSDDAEYQMRRIRETYITGTSCTIVLCGAATPWRKFVDWEIKATLDREHGLIGVNLPTNAVVASGKYTVPDRLHDNIESGYALWVFWMNLAGGGPVSLAQLVETANARHTSLIANNRPMMARNGVPPWQR
jgi:hypothetical protein